jgi:multiple antibiotic resistance protein
VLGDADNPIIFALSTLTTVFFVVDPVAAIPIFISMTASDSPAHKRRTALRASLASFIVLGVFAAAGGLIFQALHISVGAFRIAGGILLFLLAVDMLRAQRSRTRSSPEEEIEGVEKADVSIFPLAIPMLAGPGSTSTVMVLMSRAERFWQYLFLFAALAITAAVTYLVFRASTVIERRLRYTGLNVIQRIMGLILAATAMQFVVDGISDVLPGIAGALDATTPPRPSP